MRCPCLDCQYRDEDKSCGRCRHCQARIDYARQCDPENFRPIILDSPELTESMSNLDRDEIEEIEDRPVGPEEAGETVMRVCRQYQVDYEAIMAGSNDRRAMLLPEMAMTRRAATKALRELGMARREIAKFLNISYPAVCQHLRDEVDPPKNLLDPWKAVDTVCAGCGLERKMVLIRGGRKVADARTRVEG